MESIHLFRNFFSKYRDKWEISLHGSVNKVNIFFNVSPRNVPSSWYLGFMKQRKRKSNVPYLMDKACIGRATSSQRSTAITVKFPILANPRVDINQAYLKEKEKRKGGKRKENWENILEIDEKIVSCQIIDPILPSLIENFCQEMEIERRG